VRVKTPVIVACNPFVRKRFPAEIPEKQAATQADGTIRLFFDKYYKCLDHAPFRALHPGKRAA
jgi:hypothetical protein